MRLRLHMRRSVVLTALAVALSLSPELKAASLSSELDGMFANATAPGSFNSQLRNGFVGGGIGVRTPVRPINLIAFDPPRLAAGCGGIDLYGGSFSFINSEQLQALLRQIAANAIGVAFKAAIDYINPALGKIMGDFQSILQSLMQNLRNTCALAHTVVNWGKQALFASEESLSAENSEGSGGFVDRVASITDSVKGFFSSANRQSKEAADKNAITETGNLVWKALGNSGAADEFGNLLTGESTRKASKEFVMSLSGTVVVGAASSDSDSAKSIGQVRAGTVDLYNIRDGAKEGQASRLEMLRCPASGYNDSTADRVPDGPCTTVTLEAVPSSFTGVKEHVAKLLYGSTLGAKDQVYADSIIAKINSCESTRNECGFTAQQRALLNAVSAPLLGLLVATQQNTASMTQVAKQLEPLIVNEITISYGDAALRAIRQAFSGKDQTTMPPVIEARERLLSDQVRQMREENAIQWDRVMKAKEYSDILVKFNPAIFRNYR